MTTINISLPDNLKLRAQKAVKQGDYASFSDLVRDALRKTLLDIEMGYLQKKLELDIKKGKATVLKNNKDIDEYFKKLR